MAKSPKRTRLPACPPISGQVTVHAYKLSTTLPAVAMMGYLHTRTNRGIQPHAHPELCAATPAAALRAGGWPIAPRPLGKCSASFARAARRRNSYPKLGSASSSPRELPAHRQGSKHLRAFCSYSMSNSSSSSSTKRCTQLCLIGCSNCSSMGLDVIALLRRSVQVAGHLTGPGPYTRACYLQLHRAVPHRTVLKVHQLLATKLNR